MGMSDGNVITVVDARASQDFSTGEVAREGEGIFTPRGGLSTTVTAHYDCQPSSKLASTLARTTKGIDTSTPPLRPKRPRIRQRAIISKFT